MGSVEDFVTVGGKNAEMRVTFSALKIGEKNLAKAARNRGN